MKREVIESLLKMYDKSVVEEIINKYNDGDKSQLLPVFNGIHIVMVKGQYFLYAMKDTPIYRGVYIKDCISDSTFRDQILSVKDKYMFGLYLFESMLDNKDDVDAATMCHFIKECYTSDIPKKVDYHCVKRDKYEIFVYSDSFTIKMNNGDRIELTDLVNLINTTNYGLFTNLFVRSINKVINDTDKAEDIAFDVVKVLEELQTDKSKSNKSNSFIDNANNNSENEDYMLRSHEEIKLELDEEYTKNFPTNAKLENLFNDIDFILENREQLKIKSEFVIDYAYKYFLFNDISKSLGNYNRYMVDKFGFNPTNLDGSDTYRIIHCFDKAIILYDNNPEAVKYSKLDWTIVFDGDMSFPRIKVVLESDFISTEVDVVETKLESLVYRMNKFKDRLHDLNVDEKGRFVNAYESARFISNNLIKLLKYDGLKVSKSNSFI